MKIFKFLFLLLLISHLSYSQDKTVYITEKGKKYHRQYCRTTKNSNTTAISLSKAKSMGYSVCKVCNP
ncbi:hypothetical protein [Brachyspira hampsonii]|uniref:Nuclease n=1 Tax=Brachyspira hampsonii TaxID=1287055 RepID=A0AAC9XKQ2_9SPIR|nr:hypothetical protein [Brachyspira hampsonii]ASJ21508.1 hypothetical protein BHAMNSH16_07590 [Brachyspira hampsonii]ELV06119.1 nuclease [Brachyspira hampsonii 30599]MBW5380059.1 hypothetical protein [Brachyspira hampsonii]MBW5410719.1 hypothetical protein [Brachyspira hampsonii]OEJ17990.1 hypothetical protein A9496_09295 [Brachyspira hampsonii]